VQAELSSMKQAVAATPADPITRPGEGIGIYSPGFRALGEIGELVSESVGESPPPEAATDQRCVLFLSAKSSLPGEP
jgi:hypothetical protein